MKYILVNKFLLIVLLFFVAPLGLSAATVFERTLSYGEQNSVDVTALQQFLSEGGFFSGEVTGNFFSMTRDAVKAFQASVGIEQIGVFGPLTRNAANRAQQLGTSDSVSAISKVPPAQLSTVSLTSTRQNQSASVRTALAKEAKTLTWQTSQYPEGVGIAIHLLQKVSDSPAQFVLVRVIEGNTSNDGTHTWRPTSDEQETSDLYIELACSSAHSFSNGCIAGNTLVKY